MMDHLTRFAVLLPVPNNTAETVANVMMKRIISSFGPLDTFHSNQGPEYENNVIYQLQQILGWKNIRTTPYRPQGNSVSERMHSTMPSMLAMHSAVNRSNWATLPLFVQVALNTSFGATMHETTFFLMVGQPRIPVDTILDIFHVGRTADTNECVQIAFEPARRNSSERADKQAELNIKLKPYPVFKPGQEVRVYRPHHGSDGPNPKLLILWRAPYVVCSQLSLVVYRVRLTNDTRQVLVHLAHTKPYHQRETPPAHQFDKLAELFYWSLFPNPGWNIQTQLNPKLSPNS